MRGYRIELHRIFAIYYDYGDGIRMICHRYYMLPYTIIVNIAAGNTTTVIINIGGGVKHAATDAVICVVELEATMPFVAAILIDLIQETLEVLHFGTPCAYT